MIKEIHLHDPELFEQVWNMQQQAYGIEALLIGFHEIPPLLETKDELMQVQEHFYGWYTDSNKLAGVISYEREAPHLLQICRVMVRPDHFRKGIGRALMQYVLSMKDVHTFTICTGLKNTPAITLYEQLGFHYVRDDEVAPGVVLRTLSKTQPLTT